MLIGGAFSGGAAKGAVQAGALMRAKESYDLDQMGIMSGISVGSINATHLAQAGPGQMDAYIDHLAQMWKGIRGNKDVYKTRLLGKVGLALGFYDSLYDTSPLRALLEANIDEMSLRSSGREVRVGVVDMESGRYHLLDPAKGQAVSKVMGSSAMPVFFPHELYEGRILYDGGLRNITPLASVFAEQPDEIHVFLTSPYSRELRNRPMRNVHAMDLLLRALELWGNEVYMGDIETALEKNRGAPANGYRKVRLVLWAPQEEPTDDALDFSPRNIDRMFDQGASIKPVVLE